MIRIKRVYLPKTPDDGLRVLVDRLWPRGLSKDKVAADLWMKDIGPSDELRKWFGHEPAKWGGFKAKYLKELETKPNLTGELKRLAKQHKRLTLLYSARDEQHNQAVVIVEALDK